MHRRALLAVLTVAPLLAMAAESAPVADSGMDARPLPLPASAEAAHQDLRGRTEQTTWLDEAVFTEISPLTVPDVGIRLPADQEE